MKKRFWLWKRNGVFYLDDSVTRKKISLHTSDRQEAERIRDARNEANARPALSVQLAKAYLSAQDTEISNRTWQDVIDRFCALGKPQTQEHRRKVSDRKPQCYLKNRKLIETTADDLLKILEDGGVMTNTYIRCLHNLAVGLGWLPWPILASKMWPKVETKPKRGITSAEQEKIVSTESNSERKLYYQLLWEIGAAQSDTASLTTENINWKDRTLSFQRQKTGAWSHIKIGERLEHLLRQLPKQGMLFPKWGATDANSRAAEFRRRCKILEIEGISLHSYRYAWAERAKAAGYPERYAQEAWGTAAKHGRAHIQKERTLSCRRWKNTKTKSFNYILKVLAGTGSGKLELAFKTISTLRSGLILILSRLFSFFVHILPVLDNVIRSSGEPLFIPA